MKKKLELGSQVDINASFDGGADDTSVTYSVPADQQDILSVTSAGVVEALAVGTGTVEIKDTSGNLLRAVVFQVLSAEDFAMQDDLDTGVVEFTAEFAEVPVAPPAPTYTLVTGGTARSGGNYAFPADHAFDGIDATYWESLETFGSVANADVFIGKQFPTPKQIKKLRVIWRIPPTEVDVIVADGSSPVSGGITIMTIPVVYADDTVQAYMQAYDIILPAYVAKTGIYLRPKTVTAVPGTYWAANGGVIDRFRVTQLDFYE